MGASSKGVNSSRTRIRSTRCCRRRFYRSYNYADPATGWNEDEKEEDEDEREWEKWGRIEEGGLPSESETASVYSVRIRRFSSADKTHRTSGAKCEFRMDVGATRSSLCDRVGRCTFCIRSRGVARAYRLVHFVARIPSLRRRVASHRYSCRYSRWNLANPLFSANLNDFPSGEIDARISWLARGSTIRDNTLP